MAKTRGKVIMNFEVTREQREQIRKNAEWAGMTRAAFLRYVALGNTLDLGVSTERERAFRRREAAGARQ